MIIIIIIIIIIINFKHLIWNQFAPSLNEEWRCVWSGRM